MKMKFEMKRTACVENNTMSLNARLFQKIRERYKKKYEDAKITREQLIESGKDPKLTLLCFPGMPVVKLMELYGIQNASITEETKTFKKLYPVLGPVSEMLSWTAIGFGLAKAGGVLSEAISGIGPTLSRTVGYTVVFCHQSVIALMLRKIQKKASDVGMADYFQASAVAEIPASPVFFGVLSGIATSGSEQTVGVARAVSAALLCNVFAFSAWAIGFAMYWPSVIRENTEIQFKSAQKFVRSVFRPFQDKHSQNAYGEAGRIVGTGMYIWAIPWYAVRCACAAIVAYSGTTQEEFMTAYLTLTMAVGEISSVLSGIKNMVVEKIIKKKNDAEKQH
ncbi:hypothetical protein KKE92_00040 [Candidatus Micrarchaeota archaeon]|nr:hypothetical protein [Candidatus Micrarchaeota archaeon]MBU1681961.1 hypothetical protein [Candidatus Micrarchaeota archaeon]